MRVRRTAETHVLHVVAEEIEVSRSALNNASESSQFVKWDSMAMLRIGLRLEAEFELVFDPADFLKMGSVTQIIVLLENKSDEI